MPSAAATVRAREDSCVSVILRPIEWRILDCSFARALAWLSTAQMSALLALGVHAKSVMRPGDR